MASIKCRHGGTEHRHSSVEETKKCVGVLAYEIDRKHERMMERTGDYSHRTDSVGQALHEINTLGVDEHLRLEEKRQFDAPRQIQAREGYTDEQYESAFDMMVQRREREADEAAYRSKPDFSLSDKVAEVGIYKVGDTWYKVVYNQTKTRLYAKRAVKDSDAKWHWEYDKGGIYNIKAHHKAKPEEAKQFGMIENCCVNCFKDLTREESVDRGYGPTCADNMGWPYDHSRKG